MAESRLLVPGAAGFVGSAFVRGVLAADPEARVLSYDLLTYAGHLENLEGLPDPARHEFRRGDIASADQVASVLKDFRPTAVVNFAAESHVDQSLHEAARFVRTNVVGVQVLLDACRKARTRLVQVSTDEVYGSIPAPGAADVTTPLAPSSPYSASKAAGDLLALAAHRSTGQDVVITRATNTYGPRQLPEKLVPLMTLRAIRGETLPVYGDGQQERDWLHVDDHAAGVLAALRHAPAGATVHLAGRSPCRNLDLVHRILARVGAPGARIAHVADRPAHDARYALDDDASRALLGWAPRVAFEEGLAATVAWYLENVDWCRRVVGPELEAFLLRNYEGRQGGMA